MLRLGMYAGSAHEHFAYCSTSLFVHAVHTGVRLPDSHAALARPAQVAFGLCRLAVRAGPVDGGGPCDHIAITWVDILMKLLSKVRCGERAQWFLPGHDELAVSAVACSRRSLARPGAEKTNGEGGGGGCGQGSILLGCGVFEWRRPMQRGSRVSHHSDCLLQESLKSPLGGIANGCVHGIHANGVAKSAQTP